MHSLSCLNSLNVVFCQLSQEYGIFLAVVCIQFVLLQTSVQSAAHLNFMHFHVVFIITIPKVNSHVGAVTIYATPQMFEIPVYSHVSVFGPKLEKQSIVQSYLRKMAIDNSLYFTIRNYALSLYFLIFSAPPVVIHHPLFSLNH